MICKRLEGRARNRLTWSFPGESGESGESGGSNFSKLMIVECSCRPEGGGP